MTQLVTISDSSSIHDTFCGSSDVTEVVRFAKLVMYSTFETRLQQLVLWCSWLSLLSNTQAVLSSSLSGIILLPVCHNIFCSRLGGIQTSGSEHIGEFVEQLEQSTWEFDVGTWTMKPRLFYPDISLIFACCLGTSHKYRDAFI
jgi:hypothetical protein